MIDPLARLKAETLPDELSATSIAELWGQPAGDIYDLLTEAVKKGEITPSGKEDTSDHMDSSGYPFILNPYRGQPIFHKREFARWALSLKLEGTFPDILKAWLLDDLEESEAGAGWIPKQIPAGSDLARRLHVASEWLRWLQHEEEFKTMFPGKNLGKPKAATGWIRNKVWSVLGEFCKQQYPNESGLFNSGKDDFFKKSTRLFYCSKR